MPMDYGQLMDEDLAAQKPRPAIGLDSVAPDTFGTYQNPVPKLPEPPVSAPVDYGALIDEELAQQDVARNTVLDLAVPVNPDKAARVQELAKRYKVRAEAVEAEFDLIDRKARVEDLQDLARESPLLLQRLTDPDFAKVAHDDVGALARIESILSGGGDVQDVFSKQTEIAGQALNIQFAGLEQATAAARTAPYEFVGNVARGITRGAIKGTLALAVPVFARTPGVQSALDNFVDAVSPPLSYSVESEKAIRQDPLFQSGAQRAEYHIGRMKELQPRVDPWSVLGVAGAAYQTFLTSVLPMVATGRISGVIGGTASGTASGTAMFSSQVYTQTLAESIDKGMPLAAAEKYAQWKVVSEGIPESLPLYQALKPAAGLWSKVLKVGAVEGLEEGLTELADIAYEVNSFDTKISLKEALDRTVYAVILGSVTGGAMGAVTAVSDLAVENRLNKDKETTNQNTEALKQLLELNSKSSKRAPQVFSQFVTELTEGGVDSVYVDAAVLQQQAQEGRIDLAKSMPETAPQLQDALDMRGAVRIPLGEFVTALQGTPLAQSLLPMVRIGDANAPTQQELSDGKWAEEVRVETEKIMAALNFDDAWRESTASVEREFQTQLQTANRFTPDVNNANARAMAISYAVLASRLKATGKAGYADMTPELAYRQWPIDVTSEQPNAGQRIEQAAPLRLSILSAVLARHEEQGGGSFDMTTGESPITGFMVSDTPGREEVITGKVTPEQLATYVEKNKDLLELPGKHLGTLFDKESGKTFLDVSSNVTSEEEALALARQHNRLAVYDVAAGREIRVPVSSPELTSIGMTTKKLGQEISADKRLPDARLTPDEWASVMTAKAPDLYARLAEGVLDTLPQRPVTKDQLGGMLYQGGTFYSALLRAVEKLSQKKAPATDWKAIISKLPGVKKEEVDFLGVKAWLDEQATRSAQKAGIVTKEELLDFINANQVTIEEVEPTESEDIQLTGFGEGEIIEPDEDYIEEDARESYLDDARDMLRDDFTDEDGVVDEKGLEEAALDKALEYARAAAYESAAYEYFDQELGYRIIGNDDMGYYVTDPDGRGIEASGSYYKSYNDALAAAEVHANENAGWLPQNKYQGYTLPGGKDYHEWLLTAPGRAGGYRDPHYDSSDEGEDTVVHVRFDTRKDVKGHRVTHIAEIQSGLHQGARRLRKKEIDRLVEAKKRTMDGVFDPVAERRAASKELPKDFGYGHEFPDAPFKEVWPLVAIKTMIRRAVDEGHDAISWDTGETQISRYENALRKSVDTIEWSKTAEGVHLVGYKYTARVVDTNVKETALSDAIGKAMADKIKNDPAQRGTITGEGITVSDTGMSGSYDDILVKLVNSYVEQFGAKVEDSEVQIGFRRPAPAGEVSPAHPEADTRKVHKLVITPALKEAALSGQQLFQQQRASLTIPSDPSQPMTLALMKAADLSSFHHEGAHGFLEIMSRIAALPNAPVEIIEDMNKFFKWAGIEGDPTHPAGDLPKGRTALDVWNAMSLDQKRPYHEKFARGYEMYLFEGKAPSVELEGLFARFRSWMVNVYRSQQGIKDAYTQQTGLVLPDLTDEMRGVYGRLLATDEQIKAAENARVYAPLFKSKPEGMTDEEWVAYQQTGAEATQKAVETLQTRGLRDMQWLSNARSRALRRLQRGAAEKRRAVRIEVADEVMAQPIYRAMEFLRRGVLDGEQLTGSKLSLQALKEMYGEEANALWRFFPTGRYSMVGTEGLHPDQAAEILGFTSGDQLVRQLLEAEPARSVIEGVTDQRMLERYGDMVDPAGIEKAANMAVHNDARGLLITTEANALAKAIGRRPLLAAAAKSAAETMIARQKVRDLRPSQYEAAEARAGRAAEKAYNEPQSPETAYQTAYTREYNAQIKAGMVHKDADRYAASKGEQARVKAQVRHAERGGRDPLVEAATQKRAQVANHYAARTAYEAMEEVEKKIAYLKKLGKSGARKSMRGEFLEQLDAFLERFDLRTSTTRRKLTVERAALKDWLMAEAERLGAVMPDISEEMLDERTRKSYKDMTVEEIRGLFDTVRQLEHLARREQKMYTTLRNLSYQSEVSAILGDFKNAYPQAFDAEGPLPYDKSYAPKLADRVARMRSEFDGEFVNPENLLSILTLDKGRQALASLFGRLSNASDAHMAYMKRLATHLAPVADAYTFKERRDFYRKGIAVKALGGREFTKNAITSIALYWGSADGRQRIQDGFGWNETQVMAILDKLDQKDWAFVDALWRMSDEMIWPDLKALNERTKGTAPPKIEAMPYTTKFGEARGGYAPLVYDGEVDSRSQSLNNDDAVHELLGGTARQAVTRQSASKARVEKVTRKLDMSLSSFTYKINETVHDITHREAVADTWRLLQSKRIGNAIRTIGGPAVLEALKRRVRETAVKPIVPAGFTTKALWFLRRNTLINMMGLSFNTVAINVLGASPAIREVGAVRFARAAAKFANPATAKRYFDFIMEKSRYMVHRPLGFDRDMNTEMSRFTTRNTILPSMATWFVGLAMMDRAVTLPTWLAAYEKHMEEGPVPNDIDASVEAADRVVRRTQGSGRKIDLADIAGGTGAAGEFKHIITMYYNFFSAQLGQMVLAKRISKAQWNDGQRVKAAVNLTLATLSVIVIPAVLEALARGTCDGSEDAAEWAGCLTQKSVFFTANFVPLARDFVPYVWSQFDPDVVDFGVRLSPTVNAMETLGRSPKAAYDFGQGEADENDYRTLVRSAGYAFGLPGFQAWRTLDGYQALVEGDSDDLTDLLTGPKYKK